MRNWFVILSVSVLFVSACGEASRKDLLPRNTGSDGEVCVVAPTEVWSTTNGDIIKKGMNRVLYGLPQAELMLKRIEVKEQGFQDHFRTHRNVLKFEVHPKKENSVQVRRNAYARQQLFITINLQTWDDLDEVIEERMDQILDMFYEAEIDRLIERNKDFGRASLNAQVKEKTGLSIIMQDMFSVAVENDQFLWMRLDQSKPVGGYQHTISQGFMIYWRPYTDAIQFSDSSIYEWKNTINGKYVKGPQESHMTISEKVILPQSKLIDFHGQTAKEIRGLWRMEGYFMGGPFYSLVFFNPDNGMQYMVEGYAYAPQFDKAPLIREIEAIAKSVQPSVASTSPAEVN